MEQRVAAMLNYFLLFLAGPERTKLKVKDPEKYGWKPKELLGMITQVYVHLFEADEDGAFVAAVVADGRSYRDEVLTEAASLVRQLGLKPARAVARRSIDSRTRAGCPRRRWRRRRRTWGRSRTSFWTR